MPDLKYEKLDITNQQQQLDGRLRDLETQHYTQRLNLVVAKTQPEIDAAKEALNALEKDIRELRKEEDALKTDQKAG
jgi:predicted  nucleic acid-binding Zn-ribbon protein